MFKHLVGRLAATLIGVALACPAFALAPDPWTAWRPLRFLTVGPQAGLPHATTTAIAQDRAGLLWIGTRGGLARYDGQRVQVFKQSRQESDSLPDNYVRSLLALPDGSVLIGTNVGGLLRFDPATNRFRRPDASVRDRLGTRIFDISAATRGGAWIASDRGAERVDASLRILEQVTPPPPRPNAATRVYAVHEDRNGTLWFGSDDGLFVRLTGERVVRRVPSPPGTRLLEQDVWAISRDRRGRLWIGTGSDGVLTENAKGRLVQPASLAGSAPLVMHRTIRAFAEGRDGRMWIATDGTGMLVHDPRTGVVRPVRNKTSDPGSLAGDTVRDLMIDRTGGLWAATELGASRVDAGSPIAFSINSSMAEATRSLADNNVRGLLTDRHGRIWAGLSNGRIDVLDRRTGAVRHLRLNGRHAGQDIKALVETEDGDILVGARGVVRIDPVTFAQWALPLGDIDGRPVISLAEVGRRLLIGGYTGLHVWNPETRRVVHYKHVDRDAGSLANDEVINISELPNGEVWLSTPGGISLFDVEGGAFRTQRNVAGDPNSLPQDYTSSILSSGGRLWVGTFGGVAEGRRRQGQLSFRAITEAEGLAGDNVSALLADPRGRIWASSAEGISVIDPAGGEVRAMSGRDGLARGAFNQRAAASLDGDLLFGGTAGITVVQPGRFDSSTERLLARPTPTVLEVDGRILPFGSVSGALAVPAASRSVRVGFALLDYAAPEEVRYSYRLDGFDRDWTEVPAGTPATAVYTNLPGGTYELRLRASVPGLHHRSVERTLEIRVVRAWHEGWPARLGALAVALVLVTAFVRRRTRLLVRRAELLEHMVDLRTRELQETNEDLERLATTDPLTGLLNRRRFMECFDAEMHRASRAGGTFSVALLDLDHFKRINDGFGHRAGDEVLRAVSSAVIGGVRPTDVVARYGGEELVILLPGAALQEAADIVERLREGVARSPVGVEGQLISTTFSGGLAQWRPGETAASALHRADKALYQAKADGRNLLRVQSGLENRLEAA